MNLKLLLGSAIALALILLPEPTTTAAGTAMGFALLAGLFGVSTGVLG